MHTVYVNKSLTKIYNLRDWLTRLTKDSKVTKYLKNILSIADELEGMS